MFNTSILLNFVKIAIQMQGFPILVKLTNGVIIWFGEVGLIRDLSVSAFPNYSFVEVAKFCCMVQKF